MLPNPWNIISGQTTPFFVNSAPVNVIVTITFQGSADLDANGVNITYAAPDSALSPPTVILFVYPNQTVTVVFDVAASGGVLYSSYGDVGNPAGVIYEVENILWGRG